MKISNHELIASLKTSVKKEKEGFIETMTYLIEVQRRELFDDLGRKSLVDYLIKDLGFSETAATQRKTCLRQIMIMPQALEMIKQGTLNMSQLCELSRLIKQKEAELDTKLPHAKKESLLEKIQNKTQKQTQITLSQELGLKPKPPKKTQHNADDSATIRETFSKEDLEILEKCKDLASHALLQSHQGLSHRDVVMHVAKYYVKKHQGRPVDFDIFQVGKTFSSKGFAAASP